MEIRDFQPRDRQAYLDMAVDFYSGNASLFDVDMKKFEDTFNIGVKGSDLMRGLIITEGEQYIGYALLAFYWSCEAGGFVVQAEELYFTPETRGKGCGHRFFEWLFAAYPQARRFRLEVCPKNPQAKKYDEMTYQEILEKNLKVMDLPAAALCMENHMPAVLFALKEERSIIRVVGGEKIGTTIVG